MRELNVGAIKDAVKNLSVEANYDLGKDILNSFDKALSSERSPVGLEVLNQIKENAAIALKEGIPICQDTGWAIVFIEVGQDVHLVGGNLEEAINDGVSAGYKEGYLRKSIVEGPFNRKNTENNTPAIIHVKVIPGDGVKITFMAKGAGAENMSAVKMLPPAEGIDGVKDFVLQTVLNAGPNPCPPIIVGVGIGGTIEKAALLSKEALLRPVGLHHPDPKIAGLETDLLRKINETGIGPGGLGGSNTALAVNVETFACHMATLPVAVNISCHASRHKEVEI